MVIYIKLLMKHVYRREVLLCIWNINAKNWTGGGWLNSMYSRLFYRFIFPAEGDKHIIHGAITWNYCLNLIVEIRVYSFVNILLLMQHKYQ